LKEEDHQLKASLGYFRSFLKNDLKNSKRWFKKLGMAKERISQSKKKRKYNRKQLDWSTEDKKNCKREKR
jgi:hypothetical protein